MFAWRIEYQLTSSRSFIRYNDPTEKLCNTDVDRLEGKEEPVGIAGNYQAEL
jgi:tRNA pseudouridine13 synthase